MRIGILSDTHGVLREEFKEQLLTCDYLIHAGDFDNKRCYDALKDLHIPMYMVRGNCDHGDWAQFLPETLAFPLGGLNFYAIHNLAMLPWSGDDTDIVIFGHTHHYDHYKRHGVVYLNPGSAGNRRGESLSIVIMELASDKTYTIKRITG